MFSKALEKTLNVVFLQAREKRHEFITIEHLLLALLDNPEAGKILVACGANLTRLRVGLGILIEETTPHIPANAAREMQPTSTLSFQRVLQRAIYNAQCNGYTEVSASNVLAAIFSEPESQAVHFLTQENVHRLDILNCTQPNSKKQRQELNPFCDSHPLSSENGIQEVGGEDDLLEIYATNLNDKARRGEIDPLIGRQEELLRTMQILCRRLKNNPLLVGDAGVGKTAIVEGLAQLIVQGQVPDLLKSSTIYSLDLGILLAGTKYRGDFEKRFKSVLKALSREPGVIVFIDEIHNLVGAGSATGGTMDASNLIKPVLTTGELRCLGATTYEEFRNFFSKDHALLRRFQKVDIEEPSFNDSIKILNGLQKSYESFHNVRYSPSALKQAVYLSARYFNDRRRPDIAFDIIDEAGAYYQLQPNRMAAPHTITNREIEAVVARMAHVPITSVTSSDKKMLLNLPNQLQKTLFGQDCAIEALCNAIKLSRMGLNESGKPVGSFLFSGPTGVGKTEMAKQVAQLLSVELIRFDMSEYMERHAVSRLIGSPPGYVGFEQGGLLTEAIRKQPYAVLLLDEIEKAHSDIFNILLQVMDYGQLTDNSGAKANFRHVIIIMSTNAGAEQLERRFIGFSNKEMPPDSSRAVNTYFSPEFRNRLDAIIQFNRLDPATILKVVDKFTDELCAQMKEKGISITVSDTAKAWLSEQGYNEKMGARPMQRLIQEKLKLPLANRLLMGELCSGDEVLIDCQNETLNIQPLGCVSKKIN